MTERMTDKTDDRIVFYGDGGFSCPATIDVTVVHDLSRQSLEHAKIRHKQSEPDWLAIGALLLVWAFGLNCVASIVSRPAPEPTKQSQLEQIQKLNQVMP